MVFECDLKAGHSVDGVCVRGECPEVHLDGPPAATSTCSRPYRVEYCMASEWLDGKRTFARRHGGACSEVGMHAVGHDRPCVRVSGWGRVKMCATWVHESPCGPVDGDMWLHRTHVRPSTICGNLRHKHEMPSWGLLRDMGCACLGRGGGQMLRTSSCAQETLARAWRKSPKVLG